MSPKRSAAEFAEALVHELQHSKLNALLDLAEFHHSGPYSWLYAPWRDDSRPISGLLHGLYAFMSVVEFWGVQRNQVPPEEARRAEFAFHYRVRQLGRVLDAVHSHPALTDLGREFVAGVEKRLAAYSLAEVSPEVTTMVEQLANDHSATWRIRHVRPDPQLVNRLADAWRAGLPATVEPTNDDVVQAESAGPSPRTALLKSWLLEPQRFDQVAGVGPDAAFARGDHELAAIGYLDRIHANPGDIAAWVGYGLVTSSPTLQNRPELAYAVHNHVSKHTSSAPDPAALVTWFDRSVATD